MVPNEEPRKITCPSITVYSPFYTTSFILKDVGLEKAHTSEYMNWDMLAEGSRYQGNGMADHKVNFLILSTSPFCILVVYEQRQKTAGTQGIGPLKSQYVLDSVAELEGEREDRSADPPTSRATAPHYNKWERLGFLWRTPTRSTKKEHQGKVKETSLVLGRGARILCDPVFGEKCSPSRFPGTKRNTKLPCKFEDIPEVDSGVISLNHCDQNPSHIFAMLIILNDHARALD
ncbi:hypothetical protein EDD85DRAFT_973505 [Armillaria nabsnona]|nr:hypothetical protein EDD85DRAFT_973505 [Armillaria nabsnona]